MRVRNFRIYLLLCILAGLLAGTGMTASAAGSVSVMVDKTSLEVEDPLQVTVKTSEPEDDAVLPEITLTYDPQLLTFTYCSVSYGGGEGGLITIRGTSANLAFKAKKAGSAKLQAEAIIDEDGNEKATASKSVTIGGTATQTTTDEESADTEQQTTAEDDEQNSAADENGSDVADGNAAGDMPLSSNAYLKKFKVTDAKMKPKFSKEITDYTVTLKEINKQLLYVATTEDDNAQIVATSGFTNLKNGTNRAVLTVRAQDGTTMSYTFTIVKKGNAADEEEGQREVVEAVGGFIPIKDSELYVNTTFPEELLPEGFIKVEYVYKEQIVEAAFLQSGQVILLYLSDAQGGDSGFYLYYSGTDEFMDFIQLKGAERRFIFPIQYPVGVVIPDGFQDASMQWDDKTVPAFMVSQRILEKADEADPDANGDPAGENAETNVPQEELLPGNMDVSPDDYYLLYAMNQDGGEGFYLYDSLEGTYQRYLEIGIEADGGEVFDEENYVIYKKKSQNRMVVIGILLFVVVVLALVILNMFLTLREVQDEDDEEDDENEREEKKPAGGAVDCTRTQDRQKKPERAKKAPATPREIKPPIGAENKKTVTGPVAEKNVSEPAGKAPRKAPVMYDLRIDDSLTPKMQRERLDDDFDFEFINIEED